MIEHDLYEAEIAPGIDAIAAQELAEVNAVVQHSGSGFLQFIYKGHPKALLNLKTINAVYFLQAFDVPRPKALLGHQHFQVLLSLLNNAQRLHPPRVFQTFNIDAAGSDSSVMQRLKREFAKTLSLAPADDRGDLLLRLRRSKSSHGWDALVRLTPRPLATREWRVQNFEGALNASVAHAMIRLTQPAPDDVFLNLCCGSGTLLIERLRVEDTARVYGCDIDPTALAYAQINSTAADVSPFLLQTDARVLPFSTQSIDKLCADLPFGQLVGSHSQNTTLYPAILQEAARVARKDALFVLITHEIRLIESLLQQQKQWTLLQTLNITLNGLHPRIYVLRHN